MPGYRGKLEVIDEAAKRMESTVNVLRDRTANVESGLRERAAGVAGAEANDPDLAAVQASIRSVMAYIERNPVQSALLALGVGVIATSAWNEWKK